MHTVGTFQEEGASCSFLLVTLKPLLFHPEGVNYTMNTVYVLFNRKRVCGWRKRETKTKAEKTADALHVLPAARNGGNVR